MNADHIAAALMITAAIVWPITGCLRDLRERAEAERVAGEDQSRADLEPFEPSDTPIYDATAAHLAHAEAARDLRDERIARWLDGAS